MANQKVKILKSLQIQEEIEGATDNIKMLRRFLDCIKTSSQWQAFVDVNHHRYGKMSYECHHFYYCTDELKKLLA